MNSKDLKRLGQIVKAKYPEYSNVSDDDVGRIISKKYPQYVKDFSLPEVPVLTGSEVKAASRETEKLTKFAGYLAARDVVTTQVQGMSHKAELDLTTHELL